MKFVLIAIVVVVLLGVGFGVRAMHAGDKAPAVGTQAPDFTLNFHEGKQAGQFARFQRQMGRALFLSEGFYGAGAQSRLTTFSVIWRSMNPRMAVIVGVSMQDENSHFQQFCTVEVVEL